MTNRDLFKKFKKTGKLPTPSRVALEVMRLCHSEHASLGEIAETIKTDPALSAELLKYANSAYLFTGIKVASVEKATVKLGMINVVNLSLSFSLLTNNQKGRCKAFDYKRFWATSLARAIAAKNISATLKIGDPDEVFVCGLLAQMGKLAMACIFPAEYSVLLSDYPTTVIFHQEKEEFGLSSNELTYELIRDWQLPDYFGDAALSHEEYSAPESGEIPSEEALIAVVSLAEAIAILCTSHKPTYKNVLEAEARAELTGIEEKDFGTLFDTIVSQWQTWTERFNLHVDPCALYHEIKAADETPHFAIETGEEQITVLIADDDPLTLLNLKSLLEKKYNINLVEAKDGKEALRLAMKTQPDLIITDWKMPNLSGIELCKKLRESSSTKHTYIIILTVCENDDDIVQAFDAGADDYVVKPFTPQVLQARIQGGKRIIHFQRKVTRDREVIQDYAMKLASANRRLQQMAMTDPLTELPNRRHALTRLKKDLTEAIRHEEPLSCIIIDLDNFKNINDTYGHHVGDTVLKEIAFVFKKAARSYDTICRLGGEEFIVISTRNSLENTRKFAERIRQDIENHEIKIGKKVISITASLGVAQSWPEIEDGKELLQQADLALYKAKNNGKNRVEVSTTHSVTR